ncbi:MAG: nucleotidyltransferase domain-containing protein, partial [Sandaracinaceae bacterium]|nr:nucleotidyltransferase domain-containing protein [Sandaracinaceae bacterium]
LTPIQLVTSDQARGLAELARGSVSQRFAGHYRGYFGGMVREHGREPRVKSLLYAYRVALTGIHLFETGELRGDVVENAREHATDHAAIEELVLLKASGTEKGALPAELDRAHAPRLSAIEVKLEESIAHTRLPPEAPNRGAIERFLIEARLRDLG